MVAVAVAVAVAVVVVVVVVEVVFVVAVILMMIGSQIGTFWRRTAVHDEPLLTRSHKSSPSASPILITTKIPHPHTGFIIIIRKLKEGFLRQGRQQKYKKTYKKPDTDHSSNVSGFRTTTTVLDLGRDRPCNSGRWFQRINIRVVQRINIK